MARNRNRKSAISAPRPNVPVSKTYRSETEVWTALETLCASPGYAHALAFLCYRDNFTTYVEGDFQANDLDRSKSLERLTRSEISFLTGLMVKAPLDLTQPASSVIMSYIGETDRLMAELHSSMLHDSIDITRRQPSGETDVDSTKGNPLTSGRILRESFFYASEQAYMFQYRDFPLERYNRDQEWLLENKGFTPEDVKAVIHAVEKVQSKALYFIIRDAALLAMEDLMFLPAFTHSAAQIATVTGQTEETVNNVLNAFSLKELPCNKRFETIGAFNEVNPYPIIPVGDGRYIIFQNYCLAESSYDSPAFWMSTDPAYAETVKKNKGIFTESFSARRLRHVLGDNHVHENVYIMKGKDRVSEIDVLAIYGDRAIILQAKSKKLTEAARKGDDRSIAVDFQKAIQDAYNQGFKCAECIGGDRYRLTDEQGNPLNLRRDFAEIFVFCVVSEYYPSLARQADQFLKKQTHQIIRPPYVMDVFFLDVLCELLDTPLQFFNFLHRRVGSERVKADNEIAILSFHITRNLWFEDKYNWVNIGEDFSVDVDAAMFTRRDGLPGKAMPDNILTRMKGTFWDRLLQWIGRQEQDHVLELGYFLLESNEDSAKQVSQSCEKVIKDAQTDRSVHDATIGSSHAGITIHASYQIQKEAAEALSFHCSVSKYRSKADTWFGLLLDPDTGDIRSVVFLKSPWEQSDDMDRFIAQHFQSRPYESTNEAPHRKGQPKDKTGRNNACPCGSGKKYKKCCLR